MRGETIRMQADSKSRERGMHAPTLVNTFLLTCHTYTHEGVCKLLWRGKKERQVDGQESLLRSVQADTKRLKKKAIKLTISYVVLISWGQ
jgi:hypothetical protein